MTPEQITIFAILGAALAMFVWQRWRFDVVALLALLATVLAGLVEPTAAFAGFGHPAVITVAAVLAISRALSNSGLISLLTARLAQVVRGEFTQRLALCAFAAAISGFMNNVGALALVMPVALSTAHRFGYPAARVLMPISFASILGGLLTLIGTPPNIIVADYRRQTGAGPFAMFDFLPVGLPIALVGVAFVALVGWRLLPRARRGGRAPDGMFEVADYLTEVRIRADSEAVGATVAGFEEATGGQLGVLAVVRGERRRVGRARLERLQAGDILVVVGAASALEDLIDRLDLELVADGRLGEDLRAADIAVVEAVVAPRARLEGRTPAGLRLRTRYGVNVLAVAREGRPVQQRLRDVRLQAGDVLLIQGEAATLAETVADLGCLPLATRPPKLQPRRALMPVAIFGAAIVAAAFGVLPAALALTAAVVAMVLVELLPAREVYESIDWPVIVLLGAMIPVGGALETTGATALIADAILGLTGAGASPLLILTVLLLVSMTLSDAMNNAATAVVLAPLAIGLAG
ncbi:MAG TPA: SLC13 family permease, partial [Geminicoccaceae bacterium]|nr:SLC13 family permease [Geminicoccaceae bacterium]